MKSTVFFLSILLVQLISVEDSMQLTEDRSLCTDSISVTLNPMMESQDDLLQLNEFKVKMVVSSIDTLYWKGTLMKMARKMWKTYYGKSQRFPLAIRFDGYQEPDVKNNKQVSIAKYCCAVEPFLWFNPAVLEYIKANLPDGNWESGIASILGHEIWHHVQHRENGLDASFCNNGMHFLQHTRNTGSLSPRLESEADINGCFMAYLAGYDPEAYYCETIDLLYSKVNIPKSRQYEDKEDRMKFARRAMEKVKAMAVLFNAANHMTLLGNYETAYRFYEGLLEAGYHGPELYFNQGVLKIMEVLDQKITISPYQWPVKLERIGRLNASYLSNIGTLGKKEEEWLREAASKFDMVLAIDPNYISAHINQLIVSALVNNGRSFNKRLLTMDRIQLNVEEQAEVDLIKATYELRHGSPAIAEAELTRIAKFNDSFVSRLAERNLNVYLKKPTKTKDGTTTRSNPYLKDFGRLIVPSEVTPVTLGRSTKVLWKDKTNGGRLVKIQLGGSQKDSIRYAAFPAVSNSLPNRTVLDAVARQHIRHVEMADNCPHLLVWDTRTSEYYWVKILP